MATLTRELRDFLVTTVRDARRIAEAGARKAIGQLAVHHHEPWPSMTLAERELRNRLRAHGRQLGDQRDERRGAQGIDRLAGECAYEHWHRMLFARYLAECELLIEPQTGVAISLGECEELARAEGRDWLELAAEYAQRMLPQIFRSGDPVLEVALPPETRSALEDLMKALPRETFVADDSLGWVYQYWQADRKQSINLSEVKIGAEEVPAVTQLFTEDYMVLFLLHNTLGAWWAGRFLAANPALTESAANEDELRAACAVGDVEWTYLRFVRDEGRPWRPAAGTFDGWPKAAKDITLLDPCMGSGHFLVFALPMIAAMRAAEEGLSPELAIEAVLCDNLYGLEIDPRCTQIAAFNLAFAAWRRIGYRQLPSVHLACSGLSLGVSKAEWLKLAERAAQALPVPPKADLLGAEDNLFSDAMKRGFERLYQLFVRAPWIGSLIDPRAVGGDLVEHGFDDLEPLLAQVLTSTETAELAEMAVAAQGLAKAAQILAGQFTLIATNVPYLGRGRQDDVLKSYCGIRYPQGKADLATCFVERALAFCVEGGSVALVTPQNWLFLAAYKELRKRLLREESWRYIVRLGPRAFETIGGDVVKANLLGISRALPNSENAIAGVDVAGLATARGKAMGLIGNAALHLNQFRQLTNPDSVITLEELPNTALLREHANVYAGSQPGQTSRVTRQFWELDTVRHPWVCMESSPDGAALFSGKDLICLSVDELERLQISERVVRGRGARGKEGLVVAKMSSLPGSIYCGQFFDDNVFAIIPSNPQLLPALLEFVQSGEFANACRKLNQKLNVTVSVMESVPFDAHYWRGRSANSVGSGLVPNSESPNQWLFGGHPARCTTPLQSAVARLLGYRWPRQSGISFPGCPSLDADELNQHADPDGIVALNPLKGAQPASARLLRLLANAFSEEWSASKLDSLLVQSGYAGRTIDDWLRHAFFEQHCLLFRQRPFVWHIWDGRQDGFHALLNYHRLAAPNGEGRRTLEKLIYSYLGDWIDRQREDQRAGVEGADARVAAAEHLKSELTKILEGEPPYDLFVRWKPLAEQPIGWEPDINDGVRINIRPFMAAKPLGARAKGACILRVPPKIKWDKDRGKEPQRPREDYPWFWHWDQQAVDFAGGAPFDGNRWNDLHYTRAFKEAARARGR